MTPKVGVSVLIYNDDKILIGLRKAKHAHHYWGLPGGHLEGGESFEHCALRETEEETGIALTGTTLLTVRNTIFFNEDKHYAVIFMVAKLPYGQVPTTMEPEKCEKWIWWNPKDNPPGPLLPGLQMLIDDGVLDV